MKELSIEEKAKHYDEILVKLQEAKVDDNICDERYCCVIDDIVPELKESEDERIRKALLEMVHDTTGDSLWVDYNIHKEDAIAWLEKQGQTFTKKDVDDAYLKGVCDTKHELEKQSEQKPADWSKKDDKIIEATISFLDEFKKAGYENAVEGIDWLKSLKDRVQPQPKQEWSEEDEDKMQIIINIIKDSDPDWEELINWLKSLRPQNWTKEDKERYISCLQRLGTGNPEQPETINSKWFKEHVYPQSTWRPSDEQILVLEFVMEDIEKNSIRYAVLNSVLEQLKKLKE